MPGLTTKDELNRLEDRHRRALTRIRKLERDVSTLRRALNMPDNLAPVGDEVSVVPDVPTNPVNLDDQDHDRAIVNPDDKADTAPHDDAGSGGRSVT